MTLWNEMFFRADHALRDHPSSENTRKAKRAASEYQEAQRREYQSMVADSNWSQDDCDVASGMAAESDKAYEAWLTSVEEGLNNPKEVIETLAPTPIVSSPPVPQTPEKRRDRAFF